MCNAALAEAEIVPCRLSGTAHRSPSFATEPGAAELLCDPIARALMAADKIDPQAILAMLAVVERRRTAR